MTFPDLVVVPRIAFLRAWIFTSETAIRHVQSSAAWEVNVMPLLRKQHDRMLRETFHSPKPFGPKSAFVDCRSLAVVLSEAGILPQE